MTANTDILTTIAAYLEADMKEELLRQGHSATGDLYNSVNVAVEKAKDGWRIVGRSFFYGVYVDRGRPAGLKKVPINALIRWIIAKRFESDKKKIRSMAFAIQYNIWKHGIRNPRKLGWVTNTLEGNKERIRVDLERYFKDDIEARILNIIRLTNEKI